MYLEVQNIVKIPITEMVYITLILKMVVVFIQLYWEAITNFVLLVHLMNNPLKMVELYLPTGEMVN